MPNFIEINERYRDWYCEEILEDYLNGQINLEELIFKLDYNKIQEQIELFNALNLIMTKEYPHKCYNENCQKQLFFSDTYKNAKKHLKLHLKEFVKIWIGPYNLNQQENLNVTIPFYCCYCFKKKKSLRL